MDIKRGKRPGRKISYSDAYTDILGKVITLYLHYVVVGFVFFFVAIAKARP